MNDIEKENFFAASSVANKFWSILHYSGQGMRYHQFSKALREAVALGRTLERDRILDAINHENQEGCSEAAHESRVQ